MATFTEVERDYWKMLQGHEAADDPMAWLRCLRKMFTFLGKDWKRPKQITVSQAWHDVLCDFVVDSVGGKDLYSTSGGLWFQKVPIVVANG